MPNVRQSALIDNIIKYMEKDSGAVLSDEKKALLKKGLCYGFSVVHSYMAATGKLSWWQTLLKTLSEWDGTEEALRNEFIHPDTDPLDEKTQRFLSEPNSLFKERYFSTLDYLFKRTANYVLYNFASTEETGLPGFSQTSFLKKDGGFDPVEGKIVLHTMAAGYMDKNALRHILIPSVFAQKETIFLVHSHGHACSIRFDGASKTWKFYDPNFQKGEKSFDDISGLIKTMHSQLGFSLSIEIASWKADTLISEFDAAYQHVLLNETGGLLRENGLDMILRYTPEQLPEIVKLAQENEAVRKSLAPMLLEKNKDGQTVLHWMASKPNELASIIALVEKHDYMRQSFVAALQEKDKNNWTALHFIVLRNPDVLTRIIALAEKYEDVRQSLAAALSIKTNEGKNSLNFILEKREENQLAGIVALVEKHEDMRKSVAIALSSPSKYFIKSNK